ncbi:MAG: YkgJ family cysteine cluster protein [Verrucomicrobiales bacterium]|nr:YkgJ family cysteine cluster protein [Verrucomicrobiales bacterium]
MPVFYVCDRCTACCRWPGQVRLASDEAGRIAGHLGISEAEFIEHYTRLNASRTGLSLVDQADGACVFLDGGDCRIQPVKPQQCREFPNVWNFPGFRSECRAQPVEVSLEEWKRRVRAATGRDVEPPEVDGKRVE